MADFRRQFDRLFDDFWSVPSLLSAKEIEWSPYCEVEEEDDHYLLTAELPGVSKDDVKIEVSGHQISISGERKTEAKKKHEGSTYSERHFGRFFRSFTLPSGVDADKAEAQYKDGILKVYLPKSEAARPRQIKIGEGGVFNRLLGGKEKEGKKGLDQKSA